LYSSFELTGGGGVKCADIGKKGRGKELGKRHRLGNQVPYGSRVKKERRLLFKTCIKTVGKLTQWKPWEHGRLTI